jgi:hypothetical protein
VVIVTTPVLAVVLVLTFGGVSVAQDHGCEPATQQRLHEVYLKGFKGAPEYFRSLDIATMAKFNAEVNGCKLKIYKDMSLTLKDMVSKDTADHDQMFALWDQLKLLMNELDWLTQWGYEAEGRKWGEEGRNCSCRK